jgi:hypothetical protein
MKKPLALAFCCALATSARASEAPKGDFFAGYSYWKVADESRNGWEASLARNFGGSRKLGVVLDVSGHYKSGSDDFVHGGPATFHGEGPPFSGAGRRRSPEHQGVRHHDLRELDAFRGRPAPACRSR